MYWRRYAISSIPIDDVKGFELWLKQIWLEKEELLEYYTQNGRFPADDGQDLTKGANAPRGAGFIETEVRLAHWYEPGSIFVFLAVYALIANLLSKAWNFLMYGSLAGAPTEVAI